MRTSLTLLLGLLLAACGGPHPAHPKLDGTYNGQVDCSACMLRENAKFWLNSKTLTLGAPLSPTTPVNAPTTFPVTWTSSVPYELTLHTNFDFVTGKIGAWHTYTGGLAAETDGCDRPWSVVVDIAANYHYVGSLLHACGGF